MSTAARKARKRAGVKFVRVAKVGTPLADRAVPFVTRKVGGVLKTLPSGRVMAARESCAEISGEESSRG